MANSNHSVVSEFILSGLTNNPELQVILFGVFLVIYLGSVMGNLGLIVLIQIIPSFTHPCIFSLAI
jgi:olfactory receptor